MVFKISRIVVLSMAILSLILLMDNYLPTTQSSDRVVSFSRDWEIGGSKYYTTRGRFSDESMYILTDRHRVATYASHSYHLEAGDLVVIKATPILGIVKEGYFPEKNIKLTPFTGLLDTFWWAPIVVGLTAFIGLFFWNNDQQILNFCIVLIILFLIVLKISRLL